MSVSCEVIKDLLPLYYDDVCSPESRKLVDEHLQTCKECTEALADIGIEIKLEDKSEDIKMINNISKKWKQDKLSAFLKGILMLSGIASIGCIIAFNVIGSYVAEDGMLVEPFGFIPLAFLFAFIAIIIAFVLGIMKFVKSKKALN